MGFSWYVSRYLRRHFNAVRVAKDTAPSLRCDEAVICFVNHPGWWDPLMAFLLNELYMSNRIAYTPIDQAALEHYPVFRKLGFYGIDLGSLKGARRFLSVTRLLLKRPTAAIWMTPGGKFCDVRSRTLFQPGLGHLAANLRRVALVPLALEYTFWEERTPEALAEFGEPIRASAGKSKNAWQKELEASLAATQQSLAEKAMARQPEQFDTPLDGSAGVGGWYDLARRTKSFLTGKAFDPRHRRDDARRRADD
jgi:1-acyl-sn-glycerol-3-phosphate acyltransferase